LIEIKKVNNNKIDNLKYENFLIPNKTKVFSGF